MVGIGGAAAVASEEEGPAAPEESDQIGGKIDDISNRRTQIRSSFEKFFEI